MIATILKLSRPRFWIYLAGPYLVGAVATAVNPMQLVGQLSFWYPFLYFLIPANIILYGINDLADRDTDRYNSKKTDRETRTTKQNRRWYFWSVMVSFGLSLPLFFIFEWFTVVLLISFFLLAFGYSLRPFRFKAKPGIDALSNILYAFPGLIAVYQATGTLPSVLVLIAIACWTSAMHLFSAIPDIKADAKAGLRTTAVVLGRRLSLVACAVLWTVAAGIAIWISIWLIPLIIYPIVTGWLLRQNQSWIETAYWWFPMINIAVGFWLFLIAAVL